MMAGEWEEPERLNRRRPDHEADTIAGPERFRRSGGHQAGGIAAEVRRAWETTSQTRSEEE